MIEKDTSVETYFQGLQQLFEANANPTEQVGMEKYRRNQFSFYGINRVALLFQLKYRLNTNSSLSLIHI